MTRKHSMAKVALAAVLVAGGGLAGYAVAAQPHMTHALTALRNAERDLQEASPNKSGHRERAIELVRQAIGEVDAGIAAGG